MASQGASLAVRRGTTAALAIGATATFAAAAVSAWWILPPAVIATLRASLLRATGG